MTKVVSSNEMYKARTILKGKPRAIVYMPTWVKKYKNDIVLRINNQLKEKIESKKLNCFSTFFLTKRFFSRDTSNCIKLYEDALKVSFQIDDTYIFTHILGKIKQPETTEFEKIITFVNFF